MSAELAHPLESPAERPERFKQHSSAHCHQRHPGRHNISALNTWLDYYVRYVMDDSQHNRCPIAKIADTEYNEHVYEPSDDTFALVDAFVQDLSLIHI